MTKTVYIEFTRPSKHSFPILSWIIRKVQGTPYSHVRLRWINSAGVEIVYEASGNEVKFVGTIAQKTKSVHVVKSYRIELDTKQYINLIGLCMRYAGVRYGLMQLIGIGLVNMLGLSKNPYADGGKSQICSELVGIFLRDVMGLDLEIDLDIAGPKEIEEELLRFAADSQIHLVPPTRS